MDKTTAKELDAILSKIIKMSGIDQEYRAHVSYNSFEELNLRFPVFVYITELIKNGLLVKDKEDAPLSKGYYHVTLSGQVFEGFENARLKKIKDKENDSFKLILHYVYYTASTISIIILLLLRGCEEPKQANKHNYCKCDSSNKHN